LTCNDCATVDLTSWCARIPRHCRQAWKQSHAGSDAEPMERGLKNAFTNAVGPAAAPTPSKGVSAKKKQQDKTASFRPLPAKPPPDLLNASDVDALLAHMAEEAGMNVSDVMTKMSQLKAGKQGCVLICILGLQYSNR
jgi:hypothetical protein